MDIHSPAEWLWFGVGMEIFREGGGLYMKTEITGNVL